MINVDQIQKTFIVSNEYPAGITCLVSLMRLYDYNSAGRLLKKWNKQGEVVTLAEMKCIATQVKFDANVRLMTIEQLKQIQTPVILFFTDELGKKDFVVCYGFDGKRFVIGEPTFGLMQYWPQEMERMWIKGIVLMVFPSISFVENRENVFFEK